MPNYVKCDQAEICDVPFHDCYHSGNHGTIYQCQDSHCPAVVGPTVCEKVAEGGQWKTGQST